MRYDTRQVRVAELMLRKILPDLKPVKVEYEAPPSYVDAIRPATGAIRTTKPDSHGHIFSYFITQHDCLA